MNFLDSLIELGIYLAFVEFIGDLMHEHSLSQVILLFELKKQRKGVLITKIQIFNHLARFEQIFYHKFLLP